MEQELLRLQFLRLTNCYNIEDCVDVLDIYADYILQTVTNHHKEKSNVVGSNDARILNQMMVTKILHLKQLVQGLNFTTSTKIAIKGLIDPTIVAGVLRNIFETVGMFNLIYTTANSDDKKIIIYNLWCIAGLKYRQKFEKVANTEESTSKLLEERLKINLFENNIKTTQLFLNLDILEQKKIINKIKEKDYKIVIENNKVFSKNWQDLSTVMGDEKKLMEELYTYCSLYTHPSNVAVFQFGGLFSPAKEYLKMTIFNLKNCFVLLSIFIADYIKLFPETIKTYETQPLINKIILDFFNTFSRGDNFAIGDSRKALG